MDVSYTNVFSQAVSLNMTSDSNGDDPNPRVHPLYMQPTRGGIIRKAREQKRISQERLGELTGVTRSAVSQWESNTTEPDSADRLRLIAEVLGIDLATLVRAGTSPQKVTNRTRVGTVASTTVSFAPPALVVWRAVPYPAGRLGGFVILHEKEGEVPRPVHLLHQTKAFAFKVVGEENAPVYKLRDTLLVDPNTAAIAGDDCFFADGIESPQGSVAMVGYLVRGTPALWIITQYGSQGEIELPKVEYPHAWPIVGRYHRR
jgi:transcriptional regulator with XRE-family HTH domain